MASHNEYDEDEAALNSNFVIDPTTAAVTAPTLPAPLTPSQTAARVAPDGAQAAGGSGGGPLCSRRGQRQL